MKSLPPQVKGSLGLLLVAAIWGCAFVAQRSAMSSLGPFTFGGVRFLLAAACLSFFLKARDQLYIEKKMLKKGLVLGFWMAVGVSLQQIGVVYTSASKAGFITGLYIIGVPVLLWLVWRQSISRLHILAVLVATIGLYLLSVKDDFSIDTGDTFVFLATISFSVQVILADRYVKTTPPLILALLQAIVIGVSSMGIGIVLEAPDLGSLKDAWIEILYGGLISAGLGYTLQIVFQKDVSAPVAAILMGMESVFAAVAGGLILAERLTSRELGGCILMFGAALMVNLVPLIRREKHTPKPLLTNSRASIIIVIIFVFGVFK